MNKWFSLYPQTIVEFTSEKELKIIYDLFYQEMILKDSETRIAFISKDEIKKEYQFEVFKEFVIIRGNAGSSINGRINGWGLLMRKNKQVTCELILSCNSWAMTALLSFFLIAFMVEVYRSVFLHQPEWAVLMFYILLGVTGYLFTASAMKRQIRSIKQQIENLLN